MSIVSLALNVPGPVAASRLVELGASVTKIEPPDGDLLALLCPAWYETLAQGQRVLRLDLKAGLTGPRGPLGGRLPGYGPYRCRAGWIAVCALEPRFEAGLRDELGLAELSSEALASVFAQRSSAEWEAWAIERDLPLADVRVRGND